jgi:hypothetical protein
MSERRSWRVSTWFEDTSESRAAYEEAKRELDGAWEVECRYGGCTWWVSPNSDTREDLGGFGLIDCPCKANDP